MERGAPAPQGRARPQLAAVLLLVAIVAGAGGLYLHDLTESSLRHEEFITVAACERPLSQVILPQLIDPAHGASRPVHHGIVYATQRLVDDPVLAIRLPSVVAGLLALLALFRLGRLALGTREALLGTLFLGLAHGSLWAAREGRSYSLLVLVVILTTIVALESLRTGRLLWWIATGALAVLGYAVHPLGVFPGVVVLATVVLARQPVRRIRRAVLSKPDAGGSQGADLRGLLACLLTTAFCAAPFAWILLWLLRPSPTTAQPEAMFDAQGHHALSLAADHYAQLRRIVEFLGPGTLAGFAATLPFLGLGAASAFRRARPLLWIAVLNLALPLAVLVVFPFKYGFIPRYLIFALPTLALLEARGLVLAVDLLLARVSGSRPDRTHSIRPRLSGALLAAAGAALVLPNLPAWRAELAPVRQWPQAIAHLESHTSGPTLVLLGSLIEGVVATDGTGEDPFAFYLDDPDRFDFAAAGAGASEELPRALARLEPDQDVVAFLVQHESAPGWASRAPTVPLPVEGRSFLGLTLLFPTEPEAPARLRVAQLLLAVAEAAPSAAHQRRFLWRAARVAQEELDDGQRLSLARPIVHLVLATAALVRPASEVGAFLEMEKLLDVAEERLDDCPEQVVRRLRVQLAGARAELAERCVDGAMRARSEELWAEAAERMRAAISLGAVRPERVEALARDCRSAGLEGPALELEAALASAPGTGAR